MSKPAISVIIPTCHRNDLLTKCLDCLAPGVQTLPANQYEVIVTDDGSKSTAEKMVREQYLWARWVAGPRRGPAANRNNGARFAEGDWLAFTDDDCLPSQGWLEAFVKAHQPGFYVYEGKTTCDAGIKTPLEQAPINLEGGWLWSCNVLVGKVLFRKLDGFDEMFPMPHLEDVDFRERLLNDKYTIVFVPDAVVDHPPRKMAWGCQLAALHESDVYYWYKQGNREPLAISHQIILTVKTRLKRITNSPICVEDVSALCSLIVEVMAVLMNIRIWNAKYQTQFAGETVGAEG